MSIRSSVKASVRAFPKRSPISSVPSEISTRASQIRGIASSPLRTSATPSQSAAGQSQTSSMRMGQAGQLGGRRLMSSGSSKGESSATELTPSQPEYERISEEDMETLSENLGALCEQAGREKWEVDYSSGVLTLSIPPHGTYVLNKQPPNQQIWISSPVSGPSRFGYVVSTPSDPSTTGPMSSESTLGDDGGSELRGAWTHFRRPGVTLGGLVEGELRVLGVGKDEAEGWTGVGIK